LRTANGARLHIAPCPHILGARVWSAAPSEILAMTVCSWCEAEINGVGRTYFDTLDDSLRFFGAHVGTETLIRSALRFVAHDQIWVPNSRSYIALGREGAAVAWVGKTYVVPTQGAFVALPGYQPHDGGGAPREERIGETCTRHFIARGLNGACDLCD